MQRPKPDPVAHGFYADILHFLRKRMDNASDAADMTQDVFAQWLGYRDRAKVEQPRAFLFQVARNLLSELLKASEMATQVGKGKLGTLRFDTKEPIYMWHSQRKQKQERQTLHTY